MKRKLALILCIALAIACLAGCRAPQSGLTGSGILGGSSGNSEGTVSGNTYINDAFDFKCNLGSEWTVKTKTELDQINSSSQQSGSKTVFYGETSEQMDNIMIITGALSAGERGQSEREILEQIKGDGVAEIEAMGATVTYASVEGIYFAGDNEYALRIKGDFGGIPFEEVQIALKEDGDFCIINIFSASGKDMNSILMNFTEFD